MVDSEAARNGVSPCVTKARHKESILRIERQRETSNAGLQVVPET